MGELSRRLSPWSLTISCTLTEARGTAAASGGGATGGGASRTGETPRGVSWSAAGAPFSAALMVGRAFQSSAGRSFLRGLVNVRESKVRLGHWEISSSLLASEILVLTSSLASLASAIGHGRSDGSQSQVSSSSFSSNRSTSMMPRSSSELSLDDLSLSDMLMFLDCLRSLLLVVSTGERWFLRSCLFCSSSCRTLSLSSRISSSGSVTRGLFIAAHSRRPQRASLFAGARRAEDHSSN
uniref:Uncharacterized protein n=1 Tax=Ixodes ricinus TaxID=34613 RepID=A0A6B0V4Y1_IXORI